MYLYNHIDSHAFLLCRNIEKLQDCKVEDALILSGLYNWLEIRAIEAADDFDCSSCPYFYDGVFAPT